MTTNFPTGMLPLEEAHKTSTETPRLSRPAYSILKQKQALRRRIQGGRSW